MNTRPPVIIIGMSRSGTSILAKMLEELGMFIGNTKTKNYESLFFSDINKWLFEQSSAGIEHPKSIEYLLSDIKTRSLFKKFITFSLKTPKVISYMGLNKYLKCRTPEKLDIPWGWKDPRNTFTLPFWLDLFPQAKVIHIYRHGIDVANSLLTKQEKGLSRLQTEDTFYKKIYWYYLFNKFVSRKKKFVYLRCSTIEQGVSMWKEYIEQARAHANDIGDRAIEIKYERLLENPVEELSKLNDFCGLQATKTIIAQTADMCNKSRAYAFKNSVGENNYASNGNIKRMLEAVGY